jgi:head-tail adaptor
MRLLPLNKRCRVEYQVTMQDPDFGTPIVTWTILADDMWCGVEDEMPSRSEAVKMQLETAVNQTRWQTNFRSDVDSSMRVVVYRSNPVTYQIISGPSEIGSKDRIECMLARFSS